MYIKQQRPAEAKDKKKNVSQVLILADFTLFHLLSFSRLFQIRDILLTFSFNLDGKCMYLYSTCIF